MIIKKKYQKNLILLSIVNLLFLKIWVFLGVFNLKNNYFSIEGIDKKFFLLEIVFFIILFFIIFFLLKKLNFHLKNFLFFIMIILSLNNLRSVINLKIFTIKIDLFFISSISILISLFIYLIIKKTDLF